MEKWLDHLALTATFFTRIPLPGNLGNRISHDTKLSDAGAVFPVAGFLVGVLLAIVWWLASMVLPAMLAAGLTVAAGLLVTGALHEDGLADCADGLGGTSKRDRALEIMRDSRIGTYGTLALILSVGLRWGALLQLDVWAGIAALLIAHAGSRASMTMATGFSTYARNDGLGALADGMPKTTCYVAAAIAAIVALLFGGFAGLASLITGFAVAWGFLRYLEARLGGYTGDGLGAMQQLCEITVFLTLVGLWI